MNHLVSQRDSSQKEQSSFLPRSPTPACPFLESAACSETVKVRINFQTHSQCLTLFIFTDVGTKSAQEKEQEVFSSPSPTKSNSPTQRFTHRANITTSPKQPAKKTKIPPIRVTRLYGDSLVEGAYGKFLSS